MNKEELLRKKILEYTAEYFHLVKNNKENNKISYGGRVYDEKEMMGIPVLYWGGNLEELEEMKGNLYFLRMKIGLDL